MKWRFAPIMPLYSTPGARGRWKHDRGLEGRLLVPFAIEPEAQQDGALVWTERPERAVLALVRLVWFLAVIGTGSLAGAMFLARAPQEGVLLGFCGAMFVGLAAWIAWMSHRIVIRARQIVLQDDKVIIRRPKSPPLQRLVTQVPVGETAVRVHPIYLDLGHRRWDGVALVFEAGPERIGLAVEKRREEVDAYVRALPESLRARQTEDGPLLRAFGDVQFGRSRRRRADRTP